MEHRCGYRRTISVKVTVRTRSGLASPGLLTEASASGARLITGLPLPMHSIVILTFTEQGVRGAKRLRVEAEVVRTTEDGFGIEWVQFAPDILRTLYRRVASGKPEPGARENTPTLVWRAAGHKLC